MKPDKEAASFLDTIFLLPFSQIGIKVEAFSLDKFEQFLTKISEVHFSELSIFEVKAKLYRLSSKDEAYIQLLKTFGKNLAILREDKKIIFHPYTERDDKNFNLIASKRLGLNSFDIIIMAQALKVGVLITEDKEILDIKDQESFISDLTLRKLKIKRWKDLKF
ncbi:MAG: PIN domain-containing protein [Nitrososphaerales archaeon]